MTAANSLMRGEAKRAEIGWTPGELFELTTGLVWRLAGQRVEAIGDDCVRLSEGVHD